MNIRLSNHFTLDEAVRSATAAREGIDNTPAPAVIERLSRTAIMLEAVRSIVGGPLHITSWYRCPALNAAVGGSPTSHHLTGDAVDFYATRWNADRAEPETVPAKTLARMIIDSPLVFDQLIAYPGSVRIHMGFGGDGTRCEVLTKTDAGYEPGLLI